MTDDNVSRAAVEASASGFARMFGDHTTATAMLLYLAQKASEMPDGPIRSGMTLAVEEGSAWLDGTCGDGCDNMQTLMEQVTGLLEGSYMLQETPPGPLGIVGPRALPPAPAGEGEGLRERNAELCSLAHGWMVAHDRLKAGEPYELPKPVPPGEIERLRDALLRRLWEDCPSERQEHCELDPSGCKCRAALSQTGGKD